MAFIVCWPSRLSPNFWWYKCHLKGFLLKFRQLSANVVNGAYIAFVYAFRDPYYHLQWLSIHCQLSFCFSYGCYRLYIIYKWCNFQYTVKIFIGGFFAGCFSLHRQLYYLRSHPLGWCCLIRLLSPPLFRRFFRMLHKYWFVFCSCCFRLFRSVLCLRCSFSLSYLHPWLCTNSLFSCSSSHSPLL